MNTVLIVASDDALRARLMSALRDHSVFAAPNDAEALKTLRLIEIDVVLRGGAGMPRDIEPFVARVQAIAPSALTVAIGAAEESETADFTLPVTFTQRELDGVLRRVIDKLRLTREITALRSSLAPEAPGVAACADEPWEGAAFARVLVWLSHRYRALQPEQNRQARGPRIRVEHKREADEDRGQDKVRSDEFPRLEPVGRSKEQA